MKYGITAENVELFTASNLGEVKGEIRGIVVDFHGQDYCGMINEVTPFGKKCAENGIVYLFPYCGPWGWMGRVTRETVDEIIDRVCERLGIEIKSMPLVVCGGSMGGHACLDYCLRGKYRPVACAADSPVCDLVYHFYERPDIARAVYHAYRPEGESPDVLDIIKKDSPMHNIGEMPDIDYLIVHGSNDVYVEREHHSGRFVKEMRAAGRNVRYIPVEGMRHCDMPPECHTEYEDFVISHIASK